MTTYTVSPAEAEMAAQYMQSASATMQETVDQMNSTLNSVLQYWQEAAKEQYVYRQAEWNQQAQTMWTALTSAQNVLSQITEGYVTTTQQGVKMWGG